MDTISIYHVEPMHAVGMPLLITAVTENTQKQWVGEMHLLLQDTECTAIQVAVTVDGTTWPICDAKLDEHFIEQELVQQASWRLVLYLQEHGYFERYGFLPRPVEIAKTNLNALYAFWMQSKCGDKLLALRKQTKSSALSERLDLVTSLPRFRYDELT